jgi:hypothetical protein
LLAEVRPPLALRALAVLLALAVPGGAWLCVELAREGQPPALLACVCLFLVLATGLAGCAWRERLCVHEGGVARRSLLGEVWLPFEDVEEVRLTALAPDTDGQALRELMAREPRWAPWRLPSLKGSGGRRIVWGCLLGTGMLRNLDVLPAMCLALERLLPVRGERALARLRAGDAVRLGEWTATWEGLLPPGGKMVPWGEVEHAAFGASGLQLVARGPFVLPFDAPDLHLLLWLCQAMPALAGIRAAVALTSPEPATTSTRAETPAPVAPVAGFPAEDAELGRLLGGQPRRLRAMALSLVWALAYALVFLGSLRLPELSAADHPISTFAGLLLPGLVLALAGWRGDGPFLLGLGLFFGGPWAVLVVVAASLSQSVSESFTAYPASWFHPGLVLAGLSSFLVFRREGLAVYEHGLRDGRSHAIRWLDCRHLTYGIGARGNTRVVMLCLEGPAGRVSVCASDAAGEAACLAAYGRALPLLVQRAGKELADQGGAQFGPVRLTREGLLYRGQFAPWAAIRDFRAHSGRLYLWVADRGAPFLDEDLGQEDGHVLLGVLEAMRAPAAPSTDRAPGALRQGADRETGVTERDGLAPGKS